MVNRLTSFSTAAILATFAARRIVPSPTSLSPTPPILPSRTSAAIAPTLSSMGTCGSTRARVNTSIVLHPSRIRSASSTSARICAGLPCGTWLTWSYAPLMLSTTLDASSGYCVK